MSALTISFRAKRADFSGGTGYKVPALTTSHLSYDRAKAGTKLTLMVRDPERYAARIARETGMTDNRWPLVVWEGGGDSYGVANNDPRWVIAPLGNGFMAQVSITLDIA